MKFRKERLGYKSIKVVTIGQIDGLTGNGPIPVRDDKRVGRGLCCAVSRRLRVQTTGECDLPSDLYVILRRRAFLVERLATAKLAGCSSTRITAHHTTLPCEQFERSENHMIPPCASARGSSVQLTRSTSHRPGNTHIRLCSCAFPRGWSMVAASPASRCTRCRFQAEDRLRIFALRNFRTRYASA